MHYEIVNAVIIRKILSLNVFYPSTTRGLLFIFRSNLFNMYKNPEEKFSEDPDENLQIENEILKLKMQAESNAVIVTEKDIPPDVEHLFLKSVQEWEEAYKNVKQIKVYDYIHRPDYKPAFVLNDEEINEELERLTEVMQQNNVCLHVEGQYDPRIIYQFITEELFDYETDDMQLPGLIQNFAYEEFHPNHQLDIQRRTMDFFEDWFERKFNDYSWELNDVLIMPDGRTLTKEEVLIKIQRVFDSYTLFSNVQFAFGETSFQFDETNGVGLGHSEGMVKYSAMMENGEILLIEGPFKFYMSHECSWWNIFYFVFPGFVW